MNDTAENPRRGAQQHGRGQPSEKTLERTRLVYISYFGFYLPSAKTVTAAAGLMQSAVWSLTDVLRRRSSVVLGPRSFLLQLQSRLRSATQCYSGLNLKTECSNRKIIQLWSDEAEKVTVFLCTMQMCLSVSAMQYQDLTPSFLHSMWFFFDCTLSLHPENIYLPSI